jgi:hypothetical protein
MLALHKKLIVASIPADKYEPLLRLYQRQPWREPGRTAWPWMHFSHSRRPGWE